MRPGRDGASPGALGGLRARAQLGQVRQGRHDEPRTQRRQGGDGAALFHPDGGGAAGITHAGTGQNLAEARMPGYLETKNGRVALIATTCTF